MIAFNALRIPDAKLLGALSIFAKCQAATWRVNLHGQPHTPCSNICHRFAVLHREIQTDLLKFNPKLGPWKPLLGCASQFGSTVNNSILIILHTITIYNPITYITDIPCYICYINIYQSYYQLSITPDISWYNPIGIRPSQWDEPGLWFILHGVVSFAERTLPYLTGIPWNSNHGEMQKTYGTFIDEGYIIMYIAAKTSVEICTSRGVLRLGVLLGGSQNCTLQ